MSFVDILLTLALIAVAALAIGGAIRRRKSGKGCCGSCASCSGCDENTKRADKQGRPS